MKIKSNILDTLNPRRLNQLLFFLTTAATASLLTSCSNDRDVAFYCYDEEGHPLSNVLFACTYTGGTLMAYYSAGVNYRLSNPNGVARFARDNITIRTGLSVHVNNRNPIIYSNITHSNNPEREYQASDANNRGSKNLTTEETTNGRIKTKLYFKDYTNDPVGWHKALTELLKTEKYIKQREYGWNGTGIERLQAIVTPYVKKERELFLEKYGTMSVPQNYIDSWIRFKYEFPHIPKEKLAILTFRDITPAP